MAIKIQDPIHGAIEVTDLELKIIDSAPFQRLRRVKQLGNVHLVFPGATHNRASHSIGVMHTAGLLFQSLFIEAFMSKDEEVRNAVQHIYTVVRLAGLVHDLGHGAYSHLFEDIFKRNKIKDLDVEIRVPNDWLSAGYKDEYLEKKVEHEDFSFGLVYYLSNKLSKDIPAQDMCSLLDDHIIFSENFQEKLKLIGKKVYSCDDTKSLKACIKSILSGEVDADRLDYLQRDSHYCGIKISALDMSHILSSIRISTFEKVGKQLFCIKLDNNAISPGVRKDVA